MYPLCQVAVNSLRTTANFQLPIPKGFPNRLTGDPLGIGSWKLGVDQRIQYSHLARSAACSGAAVSVAWGTSENNRKAKFYSLTRVRPHVSCPSRSAELGAHLGRSLGACCSPRTAQLSHERLHVAPSLRRTRVRALCFAPGCAVRDYDAELASQHRDGLSRCSPNSARVPACHPMKPASRRASSSRSIRLSFTRSSIA